ncbi:S26 family signal peptidase [Micromonospora zingiberis]|uniref:signal peptidase I n=1 Tax=Micromonospora zingiberis TaxID=2053011 RepID=A0A4R0GHI2_9ACTN|nr:S26 family signal peptidase [Micromonospora zingiberis]TCB96820.1 S26 family signal peptidase [Micromonospora zingiberis]
MSTGFGLLTLLLGVPLPVVLCSSAAVVVAGIVAVRRGLAVVTVRGQSMWPTYGDGDRVLVRRGRAPRPGQVVVLERPDVHGWLRPPMPPTAGPSAVADRQWMIKRVVAVPGDPVPWDLLPALSGNPSGRVPAGQFVVVGDNLARSWDSRLIGYVPAHRLLGRVRCRLGSSGNTQRPWS